MITDERYTPFRLEWYNGTLLVRVRPDGTPEFGPGVTAENVWQTIAEALPAPTPAAAPVDRGDYIHTLLPSVWPSDITSMTGLLVTLPEPDTFRRGWSGV